MGEIEARMGIIPLEELLAERDELVQQVARLRARHGPGGTWPDERKVELSKIAAMIRAQAVLEGKKMTEAWLDECSHSHDQYAAFIAAGTTEKADWVIAEARIEGIDFTIQRGQAIARYLSAEVHLTP